MPRKKMNASEEPEQTVGQWPEPEATPRETPTATGDELSADGMVSEADQGVPAAGEEPQQETTGSEAAGDAQELPPAAIMDTGDEVMDVDVPTEDVRVLEEAGTGNSEPAELPEPLESGNIEGPTTQPEVGFAEETAPGPEHEQEQPSEDPSPTLAKSDRQLFFETNFNELDRSLTPEERKEWNSIYASYRGRSALTGTIIGVDPRSISIRNRETGELTRQTMLCAVVVPYRVRILIPASEMWERGSERPDFVMQNTVGAAIDFIITKVDREGEYAIASRRLALRARRYFFSRRTALHSAGARLKCRILSVGPRRCLVECYGHDINLTQRELRYTAIPDLRHEYHSGQELDCIVKSYDPEEDRLAVSVKETESNPFDGAEQRHPVGSRRQAMIAGKYGGGVFCNLPDGTVCMCSYSYQHEDADFMVGDTVILVVQRYEREKRQMYGKILTKW